MLARKVLEYIDFGHIEINIGKIMNKRGISVYELSTSTNVRYQTIQKLEEGMNVLRVNLEVLAKICYVLDCNVGDLLEYKPPKNKKIK